MENITKKFVEKIIVERNKTVDGAIFGEIQQIAVENGIETKIVINEKAVVDALKKRTPIKVNYSSFDSANCPSCNSFISDDWGEGTNIWECSYCPYCGQALDWRS